MIIYFSHLLQADCKCCRRGPGMCSLNNTSEKDPFSNSDYEELHGPMDLWIHTHACMDPQISLNTYSP